MQQNYLQTSIIAHCFKLLACKIIEYEVHYTSLFNFSLELNLIYYSIENNNLYGSLSLLFIITNFTLHLFDLSDNEFSRDISNQMNSHYLKSLCVLLLSYNQLQGRIPPWIGDLNQLQVHKICLKDQFF